MWLVIFDMWHIKCDMWHMTHHRWREVNLLSKFQLPSSYGLEVKAFLRFGCDTWHLTCDTWHVAHGTWHVTCIRDLPRPQCQSNQTYCTAGEALLIFCAGNTKIRVFACSVRFGSVRHFPRSGIKSENSFLIKCSVITVLKNVCGVFCPKK